MIPFSGRVRQALLVLLAIVLATTLANSLASAQQSPAGRAALRGAIDGLVADTSLAPLANATISILERMDHR